MLTVKKKMHLKLKEDNLVSIKFLAVLLIMCIIGAGLAYDTGYNGTCYALCTVSLAILGFILINYLEGPNRTRFCGSNNP